MRRITLPGVVVGLAVAGLAACDVVEPESTALPTEALEPAGPAYHSDHAGSDADGGGAAVAALRRATAKYHRIDVALADGFFAPDECVEAPGVGGMGVHYVHPGRIGDGVVDLEAPDVLLYEPEKNGRMRLVGAEFVVWRADWGDPPGPTFLGQEFDHSFGEHSHGLPDHYELHLWIWRHNPMGMLAPFNPDVSCG